MSKHAKCSPSRLARIIRCPGSVQLCSEVQEQEQSVYAAEGSLLHLATERCLDTLKQGEKCPSDIVSPPLESILVSISKSSITVFHNPKWFCSYGESV